MAESVTDASGATCWPNLEPMLVSFFLLAEEITQVKEGPLCLWQCFVFHFTADDMVMKPYHVCLTDSFVSIFVIVVVTTDNMVKGRG